MYNVLNQYVFYICENDEHIYYENITSKWLAQKNNKFREIRYAKYVVKNGKRYYVNKTNKIIHKNKEVDNAKWYVNLMGGKLVYLPTINENGGVSCADYRYYPSKNSKKWYYLEEKETSGKGKSVFYHALENKDKQAEIFLIDCTHSNLSDEQIYDRINMIFSSKKTLYVGIVIIKNRDELIGVFKKKRE